MKKTICLLAALSAASFGAHAATVIQPGYNYSGYWAYVWNNDVTEGAWNSGENWGYVSGSGQTSPTTGSGYTPSATNSDPVFIGFTISMEDGVQTFTSVDTTITSTLTGGYKSYSGHIYLGDNVNLVASDWGDYSAYTLHLGANSQVSFDFDYGVANGTTFDFGQMTGGSLVTVGYAWISGKTANVLGSLTMDSQTSIIDLFKFNNTDGNLSCFDLSGVQVTDANGNALTLATDYANIQEGEFGLQYNNGYVQLVANGSLPVPEPATASLSLLGLAALMMRRRRA